MCGYIIRMLYTLDGFRRTKSPRFKTWEGEGAEIKSPALHCHMAARRQPKAMLKFKQLLKIAGKYSAMAILVNFFCSDSSSNSQVLF